MNNLITEHSIIALALRLIAGIVFLIQGYDKIFNIGMNGVVRTVNNQYLDKGFPEWIVKLISYITSYIEFVGGLLLIVGLYIAPASYFLLLDLTIVTFGMSVLNPVWDMRVVWPRLVLVTSILLIPDGWDMLCIDYFK